MRCRWFDRSSFAEAFALQLAMLAPNSNIGWIPALRLPYRLRAGVWCFKARRVL